METRANPIGRPTWLWHGLLALSAALAAYAMALGLSNLARASLLLGDYGFTEPTARVTLALFGLTGLVTTTIGLLVLARGRHDPAAVLLAMVLLATGAYAANSSLPWSTVGGRLALVDVAAGPVIAICYTISWPLFCLRISGGSASRQQRNVVAVAVSVWVALRILIFLMIATGMWGPTTWEPLLLVHMVAAQAFGFLILLWNYAANDSASRNRLKIVLVAFVSYLVSWLLARGMIALVVREEFDWVIALSAGSTVTGVLAASLIAYAVLRQRLFDLNFARNRALVYATVSFVLLAAFGGAKWVIEHLIPESWHDGSEYYSFAIALGLFLVSTVSTLRSSATWSGCSSAPGTATRRRCAGSSPPPGTSSRPASYAALSATSCAASRAARGARFTGATGPGATRCSTQAWQARRLSNRPTTSRWR